MCYRVAVPYTSWAYSCGDNCDFLLLAKTFVVPLLWYTSVTSTLVAVDASKLVFKERAH